MHISEGIITGLPAAIYTTAALCLMAGGARGMRRFAQASPEKKPLLGMGGAFIFFVSLIPLPSFAGTCSHPCGSPLAGILLGPWIGIALTGLSLLLQAAFFAHGGFSTWGANVVTLGVGGAFGGWLTFRLARRAGCPLWLAGALGGLIGDVLTYMVAGLSLSAALTRAPTPQFTFTGYLTAIYAAYLPIQGPLALGEMVITGLALHYIYQQRPGILVSLSVIGGEKTVRPAVPALLLLAALAWLAMAGPSLAEPSICIMTPTPNAQVKINNGWAERPAAAGTGPSASVAATAPPLSEPAKPAGMSGMDEAVNERLAENAGRPSRAPYLDTEAMGDVWNCLLLGAGGVCGFIIGRCWHLLFGGNEADVSPRARETKGKD
ncbi:MAG: energy-coupling factor ABC transporter permease [Lentisphaerae bacterium]|nr:energy-coupling factor ABC transporter permease [Lentisphaerota bacterium]